MKKYIGSRVGSSECLHDAQKVQCGIFYKNELHVSKFSLLQILGALIFLLLSFAYPLVVPPILLAKEATINLNPIQRENQSPGTTSWQLSKPAPYDAKTFDFPTIEGYAWTTSAQAGDELQFSVSTTSPSFSADIYRMGWYQGKGGRLMQSITAIQGHTFPLPSPDVSTGLIEANWPVAFTLKTNPGWISGMYMVKLTASHGEQAYIPFVLRSSRPADFAFIHTVNTDEGDNTWGGTSLLRNLTSTFRGSRAFKVSFDRPFAQDTGAGLFFWYEYPMVRWLEQNGYDVSYLSDPDLQNNPASLQSYHALLIVGHSEYWSMQMRDALEAAVNKGVNLAVFAANTIYWQIRYEPRSGGQSFPERVLVCYKGQGRQDPFYGKENAQVTVTFRQAPLHSPEQAFLGVMYASYWQPKEGGFPWVVANAASWVFAGTGLKNGDRLPGLVGYEYDKIFSDYPIPQGLQILATSPIVDVNQNHDVSNATLYTAASGARVFDAGTIEWSWGLDSNSSIEKYWSPGNKSPHPSLVNKNAQKITANILQNFLRTGGPHSTSQFNLALLIPPAILIFGLLYLTYCFFVWRKLARKRGQITKN